MGLAAIPDISNMNCLINALLTQRTVIILYSKNVSRKSSLSPSVCACIHLYALIGKDNGGHIGCVADST